MAKAGFWLRGARGKLAGASMGKGANGQTIMREIVTPKNPRTPAQLYQRAIMATVMRAYSAGKSIFDHSFQGLSVGAPNQQKFLSENARTLRTLVAQEYNLPVTATNPQYQAHARLVAPGVNSPVGFDGMLISDGTYDQRYFTVTPAADNGGTETFLTFATPAALEGETYADYARRNGLIANDYYTFIGFFVSSQNLSYLPGAVDLYGSAQAAEQFFIIRMRVKAEFVAADTVITADTALSEIFDIDAATTVGTTPAAILASKIGATFTADTIGRYPDQVENNALYVGLIRSRLDADLRSTSKLMRAQVFMPFGITPYYVLDVWRQGSEQVGDSELILEGGDF